MMAEDLLWKAIAEKGYDRITGRLQADVDGDELEQQTLEEWQRRRAASGISKPEVYADLKKRYKGIQLSFDEETVVTHKEVHDWTNSEIETGFGIRHIPQIESRIRQKVAMRPKSGKKRKTLRKG